jgi:hypothetical protein
VTKLKDERVEQLNFYATIDVNLMDLVIAGFVLVQSPPQDPQILRNNGRNYHCHLSRIFPHFGDGRGPPQGRLPW